MSSPRFDGKLVLVTGAAQGMGSTIARHFASLGAKVAVNDIRLDSRLESLASEIGGVVAPADISDPAQVAQMVADLQSSAGDVDVLVSNHAYMTMDSFLTYDEAQWWKIIDTNLGGTFSLIQNVLPGMRRSGAGRIVVTSSIWGVSGWPEATAYAASKAGLISLVKTLGRELGPENIVINAVAPGIIDTPQLDVDAASAGITVPEMHELYAKDIPLGRIGVPQEIAATIAMLADFRLRSLIGQTIQINGGELRSRV
jgi:NAD(P)-dependent dehydrogenase (short-subunit alcohol dehydrogenase family)